MPIRVVHVDDHTLIRSGVRSVIAGEKKLELVGEASQPAEAMTVVEKLRPDVIVLDIGFDSHHRDPSGKTPPPVMNGVELCRRIHNAFPEIRILILSVHKIVPYVGETFKAGALGYVIKSSDPKILLDAIKAVHQGNRYIDPAFSERDVNDYLIRMSGRFSDPYDTLTEREREVLRHAAEGNSSADIAELLHISPRTVETHRSNLMHKLRLRGQTDLVRYAHRKGIVPITEEICMEN